MNFIVLALIANQALAADLRYTAKVYDLDDKDHKTVLYNYRSESENVGDTIVVNNRFSYPDGKPASHEEIVFKKDGHVASYKHEQMQIGATGSIEFTDGKAKFIYTKDGKTKSDTETADDNFIIGSQIPLTIEAHWTELMKGDTLKRRLAVIDRQESVGFNYSKEGEGETSDGRKAVLIKMKPSSIIIAAIVSPLHFYMAPDGKELYEIKGRTTVRRDKGSGKFSDLDADIVYTAGPASAAAAPATQAPAAGGNSK